jgi:hypothetical protein
MSPRRAARASASDRNGACLVAGEGGEASGTLGAVGWGLVGLIYIIDNYTNRSQALEAVGLRE